MSSGTAWPRRGWRRKSPTRALGRYAVAVIGDEPRLAYNRVLLSSVLAGEIASKEIELQPAAWWRDRGVTLSYGRAATSVDLQSRRVVLADGRLVPFSKLVFATGSQPLRLNIPGADLPGVHTFRDSRDVDLLLTLAAAQKRVVVIGGGLLGLEAAYGLAKAGAPVTLIHLMDRLMERQLDAPAAALLKRLVRRQGHRRPAERQHEGDLRRRARCRGSSLPTARISRPTR